MSPEGAEHVTQPASPRRAAASAAMVIFAVTEDIIPHPAGGRNKGIALFGFFWYNVPQRRHWI